MKNFRLLVLGALSIGTATAVLIACSSDDTVVPGTDSGTIDATTDTTKPQDDGGVTDAATDATDARVLVDAGIVFTDYVNKQAEAYCRSINRCCYGDPNIQDDAGIGDSGAFYDKTTCLNLARLYGFEGSLNNVGDGGPGVLLDQLQALDCIQKLDTIPCSLTRAQFADIRETCFEAVFGAKTAGQACKNSVECAKGNFCNPSVGGGTCEALRPLDGPCGNVSTDEGVAAEACSWRAGGDTNRYCETYDFVTGQTTDAGSWTCKAGRANGERCVDALWCGQGICDTNDVDDSGAPDYVCRSPITFFPAEGACKAFLK